MVKEYRLWSSKVFPQITVGMENNALFSGAIENAEKFSANVSRKHSKIIWNIILYCFLFLFSLISPLLLFIFFLPFVLSFLYSFFFLSFFFCFSSRDPKRFQEQLVSWLIRYIYKLRISHPLYVISQFQNKLGIPNQWQLAPLIHNEQIQKLHGHLQVGTTGELKVPVKFKSCRILWS